MFPRCVKTAMLTGLMLALFACSSSPTRDEEPKQDTKSDSKQTSTKQSGKQAQQEVIEVAPPEPVGPPPIPPEATQRFENAITLMSAGDLSRAEQEFRRLADTYPEYSGALVNLGILYLKSGKLADAEKALHSATERSPQNAAAFNQLGIVYRKLGRFKEADAAYSQAVAVDPNYALAYLNLGVLCDLYLQQPERALASFERYSELAAKPDTRVATWVKELQGRVKRPKPAETATP